jgi:HK97 family phage major capsid protein
MGRQAALFQSSAFPIQADFREAPIDVLFSENNIGPLMPQGTTTSNTVRIVRETVTASGAASVAEGGTKPEANISFAPEDEPVRKIAVTLPLTDEALDDVPFLRAYLNARLRLFVQNEEDRQLLLGSGTAPELRGLLNRSGINTATSYSIGGANPDQALIDSIFKGAMRVRDAFLEPDTTVMKPSTWEIARLAKDGNRNYLLGPPADDAPQRLWGLRVVLNANMPAQVATNKVALIGAFRTAAMVVRKGGIELAISDSHSTFFVENKIMLRAEERLGLLVFRPAGFAAVTSAA